MQGMRFLILSTEAEVVNQGVIAQAVTSERYLCQFLRSPVCSRVVPLEDIEKWRLFANNDQLNDFLIALRAEKEQAEKDEADSFEAEHVIKSGSQYDTMRFLIAMNDEESERGRGLLGIVAARAKLGEGFLRDIVDEVNYEALTSKICDQLDPQVSKWLDSIQQAEA
jgi:hypothetical protein